MTHIITEKGTGKQFRLTEYIGDDIVRGIDEDYIIHEFKIEEVEIRMEGDQK